MTVIPLMLVLTLGGAPSTDVLQPGPTLVGHRGSVRCLAYGPTGLLASGGKARLVCVWDESGRRLHRVDLQPGGG